MNDELPQDAVLVRTTDVFDRATVPAGLMQAHRIAAGVWGRLVVLEGTLDFLFEDQHEQAHRLEDGDSIVIPPLRPHHVTLTGPVRFHVEFHRPSEADPTEQPNG